jgi:hypothetical protein
VNFTGFLPISEVVRALPIADIWFSPEPPSPLNDTSTFLKIAVYMALGRPVVATTSKSPTSPNREEREHRHGVQPSTLPSATRAMVDDD